MKKTVSLLLTALLAGMCACGKTTEGGSTSELLLASFESYDELFRVDFSNMAADIDLSDGYVTEGGKGVKVNVENATDDGWPDGSRYLPYAPNFSVLKKNVSAEFYIGDMQSVAIDFKNENPRDIYLGCSIYNDTETRLFADLQYVPAETAITAVFTLPRRFMTEEWMNLAKITFYVIDGGLEKENCVFSFDNVRLNRAEEALSVKKVFARNELMFFAEASDMLYIKNYCTTNLPAAYMRYASSLPGGGSGLNLRFIGTDGGNGRPNTEYYPDTQNMGAMISPDVVKMFDFTKIGKLSVELYNGDNKSHKAHLGVSDGKETAETALTLLPGEWLNITLEDFKNIDKAAIDCVYFYLDTWRITDPFDVYARNLRYGR